MTDYWKSNERKYCEYCSCWIADNKASIQFHEGGKKHKLNVAKKLQDIGKKSQKEERERQKVDIQMRQMEEAALKAYAQDINRGGDITTQEMNAAVAAAAASYEEEVATKATNRSAPGPSAIPTRAIDPLLPPIDVLEDEERAKRAKMKRKSIGTLGTEAKDQSMWVEAKSDEGHTYYWNVKSGESIWEAPKEGYMTIEEYNRLNLVHEAKTEQQLHEESKYMRANADEIVSKYRREQLKTFRAIHTQQEVKEKEAEREGYTSCNEEEEETAAPALGRWQTVVRKEVKPVDLQLPTTTNKDYGYIQPVPTEVEPTQRVFKEKTVKSLADEDCNVSNTFKKRKFGGNRRNARQRLDDDD
ncbi:WW domain-binding protein 4 isoform X1 [Sitodiplosis mosellana]|uniref:WW domain-binding protein 4 isoform X1 n=1 Tax=Sitodiplosis mosellana TaxID=263140 RepID=UPI00244398B6|nr:WW domain-binding protein 4 isoform X1 [Sitodiplosis mosellana]